MIALLSIILLSFPYTIVAPSGGSMGGGGFSEGVVGGGGFSEGVAGGGRFSSAENTGIWSSTSGSYRSSFDRDEDDGYMFEDGDFRFDHQNTILLSVVIVTTILGFVHCLCYDGKDSSPERVQQTSVIKLQVRSRRVRRTYLGNWKN